LFIDFGAVIRFNSQLSITINYRGNYALLLVLQTGPLLSFITCDLRLGFACFPLVLLTFSETQVVSEEARQWTHPMASVNVFSIVIIVYFITRNLNFNILAKFEI
jgi:hypothetical protein